MSGLLAYNLGPAYAVVAVGTVASYVVFTVKVSAWRIGIRQAMNRLVCVRVMCVICQVRLIFETDR